MKKLCLAMLAFFPLTGLASQVTLYSVVDTAITVSKHKGEQTTVKMDDGIYAGSRFGIRGQEDLGGGNSVGFTLEQGFRLSDGTAHMDGRAFSREAILNVSGNWGELAFGRAGGLSSDSGSFSILHGAALWTSYYTDGNIAGVFINTDRMDNLVVYKTPSFSGLTVTLMYSNGTQTDTEKWSKNDHYYGIGFDYSKGETIFSVMWESLDHKTTHAKTTNLITLGGQQSWGDLTLWAGYQYANRSDMVPAWYSLAGMVEMEGLPSNKGVSQHAFTVSAGYKIFGGEVKIEGNFAHGNVNNLDKKYNIWSAAAVYEYPISKRTLIYSYAGYGGANDFWKESSVFNSWTACLGINHRF